MMSKTISERTPGHWTARVTHGKKHRDIIAADGTTIARVHHIDVRDNKGLMLPSPVRANARLIACAPEMHEYLVRLAQNGDRVAAALVAKVQGAWNYE